ncbi:hypothetical protein HFO56_33865 [Rhizobium laguerreae]|uniref:hypothetical protein n=1 Tax=Rhizobium laguerreae TaxID=1076926 RepID=UPI001C91C929|nr:hypothetical protein [Rhizobium laguerreae]MBY3157315.1 hypothetical protein [Rhizobium laguerreae]
MPAEGIAPRESVFWWSDALRIDRAAVAKVEETVNNFISKGHLESLAFDRLASKPGIVDIRHHLVTIIGYFSLRGDYSLEVKKALRVNLPSNMSLVTAFGPEMISFPS